MKLLLLVLSFIILPAYADVYSVVICNIQKGSAELENSDGSQVNYRDCQVALSNVPSNYHLVSSVGTSSAVTYLFSLKN